MPNKYDSPVYVFDLDGTLSKHDPTGRVRFLLQTPKDWKAFHAAAEIEMINDLPRLDTIQMCNDLMERNDCVIITGRNEKYRDTTVRWCIKHHINYTHLLMRGLEDMRQDATIKRKMCAPFLNEIVCVFEDRDQCVNMYRNLGLTCCQVAPGAF